MQLPINVTHNLNANTTLISTHGICDAYTNQFNAYANTTQTLAHSICMQLNANTIQFQPIVFICNQINFIP